MSEIEAGFRTEPYGVACTVSKDFVHGLREVTAAGNAQTVCIFIDLAGLGVQAKTRNWTRSRYVQKVPVLLIKLDHRPDRLAQMQAEFDKVGVEFERVPAVDARNPNQDLDELKFDSHISTEPATLCSMVSHLLVMRRMLAAEIPLGMSVEDDVELSPDVLELVSRDDWTPDGTGVVQCEGSAGSRSGVRLLGQVHAATPVPGRNLHKLHSRVMGSARYSVTWEAAALIAQNIRVCLLTDHIHFNSAVSPVFRRIGVSALLPAIATQTYGGSDTDLRKASAGFRRRTGYGRISMLFASPFGALPRWLWSFAGCARFLDHRFMR